VHFSVECCLQHFTFLFATTTEVWRREEGISITEDRHNTIVTGCVFLLHILC